MACQYRQRETANRFELRRYLPISAPSNGRQDLLGRSCDADSNRPHKE
jgi:hypothetical protein